MMHRAPETEGLLCQAKEHGSGFIAFSPLAQGLLTGRYLDSIPTDSRAYRDASLKKDSITPELIQKLISLKALADERGQSLAQMALAWVLKDDLVSSVIVGASSTSQLMDSIKAVNNTVFSAEELSTINKLTTE